MIFNFMNNYMYLFASPEGGWGLLGNGTPSEIIIHVVRNHCTKFGALVHSVTIKTIRQQTII